MRPPFGYYGSKQTLAGQIVQLFPAHAHYVEPFAGSLSVLLAKPPSRAETVNDLHGDLMTFWRVLRDRPLELARVAALTPHSRAEFESAQAAAADDLEVARRVWVRLTQGRGGVLARRTGWRFNVQAVGGADMLDPYVARLIPAAERLRGVSLECRPAIEVIETYGRNPDVLIYADPPYLSSTRDSQGNEYGQEMRSDDDHAALADALRSAQAAVVLSGYPSPLYDQMYAGWHRADLAGHTTQGGAGRATTEALWSNRPLGIQPSLLDGLEVAS